MFKNIPVGSSLSRMEQNLGKAGYIFSKSLRVQLWAYRRGNGGGLPVAKEHTAVKPMLSPPQGRNLMWVPFSGPLPPKKPPPRRAVMEKGKGPQEECSHTYLRPVWSPTILLHDALIGQPVVEPGHILPIGPGGAKQGGIDRGICTPSLRNPHQGEQGKPRGPSWTL